MPRKFSKKDPFENLSKEWQDDFSSRSQEQLDAELACLRKQEEFTRNEARDNEDIATLVEKLNNLRQPYRDSLKTFSLKVRFILRVMSDRGKDITGASDEPGAAKAQPKGAEYFAMETAPANVKMVVRAVLDSTTGPTTVVTVAQKVRREIDEGSGNFQEIWEDERGDELDFAPAEWKPLRMPEKLPEGSIPTPPAV